MDVRRALESFRWEGQASAGTIPRMEIGREFFIGVIVGVFAASWWWKIRRASTASQEAPRRSTRSPVVVPAPSVAAAATRTASDREFDDLLNRTEQAFESISAPEQAWNVESLGRAVDLQCESKITTDELVVAANSPQPARAAIAIETLRRRKTWVEAPFEALALALSQSIAARTFAQRYIAELAQQPVLGSLVASFDPGVIHAPWFPTWLLSLVRIRAARGETEPDEAQLRNSEAGRLTAIAEVLVGTRHVELAALRDRLTKIARELEARSTLTEIGRVVSLEARNEIVDHKTLVAQRDEVLEKIAGANGKRRSILVIGNAGVGKSTLIERVAAELLRRGEVVFEAAGSDVIAGQRFIGEHEDRVKKLLGALRGIGNATWVSPRFQELVFTGRHSENPTSTLDLILPAIERGEIRMIGEVSASAAEMLLRRVPRLRSLFEIVRVAPLSDEDTLSLALDWLRRGTNDDSKNGCDAGSNGGSDGRSNGEDSKIVCHTPEPVVREAQQLAAAYLTDLESPGRLLTFLRRACEVVNSAGDVDRPLTRADLLFALSRLTGLPSAILDESARLDLSEPTAFFARRVLGQDEAIRTLVDRIGMLKAGLCDPKRPIGVYLFTGPTGTGKTELAKALAEYLFGSSERMLRYDMSEFQSPDSLDRLIGAPPSYGARTSSQALVDRIREQPFAVVLLDEFEKAHTSVYDLFLQLFDDGRLTDRAGNTADFRHAIVIMTSNLGGDVVRDASIGFRGDRTDSVTRATSGAFRKEFINRIDRIVAFQPLPRAIMRDVLMKELALVLDRRGLRNRQWAFEWEASAIDFLLDRGFTPDLGARPLRRAIEQHLLAPLARTILEHRAPAGDQFLFVRSAGDRLEVEFVDPDADDGAPTSTVATPEGTTRLRDLVLDATGEATEVAMLHRELDRLRGVFRGAPWKETKQALFDAMAAPGFWNSPERFATLEEVEYRDRLEVGFDSAESLGARLASQDGAARERVPAHLATRLAHDLYLLDEALCGLERAEPFDAWILIEAESPEGSATVADSIEWARRLFAMYHGFCERRRMRFEALTPPVPSIPGTETWRGLLAVSGFAAYSILQHEHGLHILEVRGDSPRATRLRARVRILAQPPQPPPRDPVERARNALEAFANSSEPVGIARRYAEEPSPLVRDAVRSWRTGRFDRVLAGDFDLF